MNTLRNNPILGAIILLVLIALGAHIYFNTDLLERVQAPETQEARTERILSEQRKQVVDDRGYFTVLIPKSWNTQTPEPSGTVLSSLTATTSDFAEDEDGIITAGAFFEISARNSASAQLPDLDLLESFAVHLGAESVPLSLYRSADGGGYVLLVQKSEGKTHYEVLMRYNSGSYPEGEQLFVEVLRSISLNPQN